MIGTKEDALGLLLQVATLIKHNSALVDTIQIEHGRTPSGTKAATKVTLVVTYPMDQGIEPPSAVRAAKARVLLP